MTCDCKHDDYYWVKSPCNECGWKCSACNWLAPGEPPGYRPDLDVTLLGSKVEGLLMDLHMEDFVYLSNSTDGECCTAAVVKECRASGYYDQYSIIQSIMRYANDSHADFWKQRGDAVREGRDARERCACGQLASGGPIGGPATCGDCRVDGWFTDLTAEPRDPSEPEPFPGDPWEAYGVWRDRWRADHPDDERGELELVAEYGRAPTAELERAWGEEKTRRESEGVSS